MRDAFTLAKEKAPTIIFIDELDAIGTKRFDSEKAGDREVQRTMLELLNQLDGFAPSTDIKGKIVIRANYVQSLSKPNSGIGIKTRIFGIRDFEYNFDVIFGIRQSRYKLTRTKIKASHFRP